MDSEPEMFIEFLENFLKPCDIGLSELWKCQYKYEVEDIIPRSSSMARVTRMSFFLLRN